MTWRARQRSLLVLGTAAIAFALLVVPADAVPPAGSTALGGVYMVDGPVVHDVVIDGSQSWIGGRFSEVENQSGARVADASNLTVFDAAGGLVASLHDDLPSLSGTNATVWDLSLGPNGILYVAGKFTYSHGGDQYKNVVGIDTSTGRVAAAFRSPNVKSILATRDAVYAGGRKLSKFSLSGGGPLSSFHQMTAYIDPALRGHATAAAFRGIDQLDADTLLVVGAFDGIDGTSSANAKKVAVRVDATTGEPELGAGSWALDCSCARGDSAAFGLALDVADGIAYVAAGGNDWVGAFRTSDGDKVWQTDTNGSAQDVAVYDASTVIVGGHWTFVEDDGPNDENGAECPSRTASDPAPCWEQPRLAALTRADGMPQKSWTPSPCCSYRGVWATVVAGDTVHVGGEFQRLDGSGPERFYGRFR